MKRVLVFIITLCILMGISSISIWASAQEEEDWIDEPFVKTHESCAAAAAVNDKIYYMGGQGNGQYISKLDIYDTNKKSWTSGEKMLDCKYQFSAVAVGNHIYTIGGCTKNANYLSSMECYNTVTNTWETEKSMTIGRILHKAVAVGNKIYVIGGQCEKGHLDSVEIYDTKTGKWSTGAPMPTARSAMGATYADGKIYVIGGGFSKSGQYQCTNIMEIYDIATDSWTVGEPLPRETYSCAAVAAGNEIYVIGGVGGLKEVDIYDIKTGLWSKGKPLNNVRYVLEGVLANGRIYAIGGVGENSMESLKVNISKSSTPRLAILLNIGETAQLSVSDNLMDNSELSWTSTNKAVSTVDSNGKVTAIAEGDAEIYAEDVSGTFKEFIPVRVVKANADEMRLAAHLKVGGKVKLYLSDDTSDVNWKSMDDTIATVSNRGHVTALDSGLAIIEGEKGGQVYQAYVRVSL